MRRKRKGIDRPRMEQRADEAILRAGGVLSLTFLLAYVLYAI